MEVIRIDGEILDLYQRERVNLNLSLNSLGDISTRNSSYSNTLKVPRTAKNERIFQLAGTMGNNSRFPYISKRCTYEIDTVTIFYNGYIQLLETTSEYYRIVIYDGIIDLSLTLGNSTVADLNYSEYDHYIDTTTAITNTFSNTEGYIYALGEFGKTINNSTVDGEKLAPSVYAHTIWDKIFSNVGLSYSGDFFTNNTEWTTNGRYKCSFCIINTNRYRYKYF